MSTTDTMFESAPIAGQTGDAYQAAFTALVALCEDIADPESGDPNWDGIDKMTGHARVLARYLRDEDYRPREKMTRADVHRNALRHLIEAVDEFDDLKDHDGGALGLNVWEAFDDAVRSAKRTSESYGPDDRGYVRLSDPRDGGGLFGGYFVPADDLGKRYIKVES